MCWLYKPKWQKAHVIFLIQAVYINARQTFPDLSWGHLCPRLLFEIPHGRLQVLWPEDEETGKREDGIIAMVTPLWVTQMHSNVFLKSFLSWLQGCTQGSAALKRKHTAFDNYSMFYV